MLGKFTQVALEQQISCSSRDCGQLRAVEVMCFSYDRDVRADLVDVVVIITVFERGAAELLGYVCCHFYTAVLSDGCFLHNKRCSCNEQLPGVSTVCNSTRRADAKDLKNASQLCRN